MVEQRYGPCPSEGQDLVDVQLHYLLDFRRRQSRQLGDGVKHVGCRSFMVRVRIYRLCEALIKIRAGDKPYRPLPLAISLLHASWY